jgi:hypothetical protein
MEAIDRQARTRMAAVGDLNSVINPMITAQFMHTGALLMDIASGDCFELNAVGAEVWQALERGDSVARVVHGMTEKYKISSERAAADVSDLLTNLLAHGILRTLPR